MNAISQTIEYQALNSRHLTKGLLLLAAALVLCYIYLVYSTIYTAVSRQNDLAKLARIESKVVSLEGKYLELASGITLERAHLLGFYNVDSRSLALDNADAKLARVTEAR